MASGRTFPGIDGCRAGWFCVRLDTDARASCRLLPDEPPPDGRGLPMEIVYWSGKRA